MNIVRRIRQLAELTQVELAGVANTSQSAIAAYESGAKTPSLRTVRRIASAVEMDVHLAPIPALTREERRSLALHERIAQRLREQPKETLAKARANLDQMRHLHPHASRLFDEWQTVLALQPDEIAHVITDPGRRQRELRQVTPFAGVLDQAERARVYQQFRREEANS